MNSEIDHQSSPAADPAPAAAPPEAVDDDDDDDHFLADLIDLIPRLAQHDRQTFLQHYDPNAAVQWLMYVLDPNNQVKNPAGYLRRCCLQQSHQPPASYTQHEVRSLLSQLKKPPAHSGNDAAAGTADTTQSEQPPGPDINTQAVSHWRNAMTELEMQFTRSAFDRWLKPAHLLAWDNDRVTIGVSDEYAKEWLESRWRRPIERTLTGIAGRPTAFQCVTLPA